MSSSLETHEVWYHVVTNCLGHLFSQILLKKIRSPKFVAPLRAACKILRHPPSPVVNFVNLCLEFEAFEAVVELLRDILKPLRI